jgi:hypothetical protein
LSASFSQLVYDPLDAISVIASLPMNQEAHAQAQRRKARNLSAFASLRETYPRFNQNAGSSRPGAKTQSQKS